MVDTTSFPYRTIVRLTDSIGGVGYEGSGVMISPDEVLTAAHMVWSTGIGVATNIQVSPGYNNGVAPFGTYAGVATHYNPINDSLGLISQADSASDYAVIHLTSPVPSSLGFMTLGADFGAGTATVSGYPGYSGLQYDTTEAFTTTATNNLLTGGSLGEGSSGGPVWIGDASGATILGTVSTANIYTNVGYFNKVTAAERATIQGWVAQDDAVASAPPVAGWIDSVTHAQGTTAMVSSSGGPPYLQWQYIWSSADGVSLSTSAPNAFLHGGAGQDSLQVTSGQNVLDGGTGSNFLTGGTGNDTFFTDARGTAVVWNTMRNFHKGDAATLWGFAPGVSSYTWDAAVGGATGSTGATLRANIVGGAGRTGNGIDASITFAGLSVAQGKAMQISTGSAGAGSYLYIYNQGV